MYADDYESQIKDLNRNLLLQQSLLKQPLEDEHPEDRTDIRADIRDEISEVKQELKDVWQWRIDMWKDCFRKEPEYDWNEFVYADYAHAFKSPTRAQIRAILETLDRDHPGWDRRDNKEPFFATLKENFPESVKAPRQPAKKQSGGCVIAFLIVFSAGLGVAYLLA